VGISRLPVAKLRARPVTTDGEVAVAPVAREIAPFSKDERHILVVVGASFLVTAIAMMMFLPWGRSLSWPVTAMVVIVLAIATRTRFITDSGYTVPIVLVTVPALFLLPPPVVPLVTSVAFVVGVLPDVFARRASIARPLVGFANSWFIVAPAVVLSLAGAPTPTEAAVWVLVLALAAQFAGDILVSGLRDCVAGDMPLRNLIDDSAWTYKVDLAFAPVGFLIAIAAVQVPWSLFLLVPLFLVMHYFSDERRRRVEQMAELNAAYRGTAMVLGDVVESDDAYTGEHSRGVVQLALEVALEMRLDEQTRRRVDFGAMLHDVGKVAIPKEIINKPGPLDPEEWEIVKTHTTEGQRMLDQVGGLMRNIGLIVRAHHERWDGTGYPDGLRGAEIPIEARIVSACDTWSAMTTTRSYRIAMSREAAMAELRSAAGTQLDPNVVDALIRVIIRNNEHRA
jgi:HD-GYP domain-containing protein (c-di-GMP phosphodiesterase class II)